MTRRWVGALLGAALLVACGGRSPARHASSVSPVSAPSIPISDGAPPSSNAPSCPTGAITAANAPFCYSLPDGFTDHSSDSDYGYGWRWRTLVAIDEHDLIQVIAHFVQADLDAFSDVAALTFVEDLALREDSPGVVTASTLINTTIDGARAFRQDVLYDSGVNTRNYNVLRGHTVVNISCQYLSNSAARVTAACDSVLAGIVIADV